MSRNTRYRKVRRFFRRHVWEHSRVAVVYCVLVAVALALFLWGLNSCGAPGRDDYGREASPGPRIIGLR